MSEDTDYTKVAELIRSADSILFLTGAGISMDSGLPTYRGIGGLYEGKVTEDGMSIEEALSATMMKSRPEVTWKYLWQIAEVTRNAQPNRGHEIIGDWIRNKPDSWVMTQNVDGLHSEANPHNVVEVHGRASNLYCTNCGDEQNGEQLLFESEQYKAPEVPLCPECQGIMRPDVVLFEEMLSDKTMDALGNLSFTQISLVMTIGTSSLFPYITAPVELAAELGIPTVEINPKETSVSNVCKYIFRDPCSTVLERLDKLAST